MSSWDDMFVELELASHYSGDVLHTLWRPQSQSLAICTRIAFIIIIIIIIAAAVSLYYVTGSATHKPSHVTTRITTDVR